MSIFYSFNYSYAGCGYPVDVYNPIQNYQPGITNYKVLKVNKETGNVEEAEIRGQRNYIIYNNKKTYLRHSYEVSFYPDGKIRSFVQGLGDKLELTFNNGKTARIIGTITLSKAGQVISARMGTSKFVVNNGVQDIRFQTGKYFDLHPNTNKVKAVWYDWNWDHVINKTKRQSYEMSERGKAEFNKEGYLVGAYINAKYARMISRTGVRSVYRSEPYKHILFKFDNDGYLLSGYISRPASYPIRLTNKRIKLAKGRIKLDKEGYLLKGTLARDLRLNYLGRSIVAKKDSEIEFYPNGNLKSVDNALESSFEVANAQDPETNLKPGIIKFLENGKVYKGLLKGASRFNLKYDNDILLTENFEFTKKPQGFELITMAKNQTFITPKAKVFHNQAPLVIMRHKTNFCHIRFLKFLTSDSYKVQQGEYSYQFSNAVEWTNLESMLYEEDGRLDQAYEENVIEANYYNNTVQIKGTITFNRNGSIRFAYLAKDTYITLPNGTEEHYPKGTRLNFN